MATVDSTGPVTAVIQYLAKDLRHESEKPYYLYLEYDYDIARTNTEADNRLVSIENARNLNIPAYQMFSEFGFTQLRLDCSLSSEEYSDTNRVKEVLYPQYVALTQSLFPDAVRIEVLEHALRRRDPHYPNEGRERHEFSENQPSDYTHIDMTASSAAKNAIKRFDIRPQQYRRFVAINFWKSISGPVYDWPLTLCDRRTIDYASQTTSMDIVNSHFVNENTRIYYDKAHKWYYWHGLQENEVIVFMQADSEARDRAGVPHTAFLDPRVGSDVQRRESVEARVYAYFN